MTLLHHSHFNYVDISNFLPTVSMPRGSTLSEFASVQDAKHFFFPVYHREVQPRLDSTLATSPSRAAASAALFMFAKTLAKVVSIRAQTSRRGSARASPASFAPSLSISQSCSRKCDREQMASLARRAQRVSAC